MHIVIWVLAALALGLWSLLAWGVATLLGLDPSWVTDAGGLLQQVPYGEVIDAWVPGWQALLVASFELARSLLGWLGGFGQVLVWVLWALGAGVVLLCAGLLSLLVVVIRRSTASAKPTTPGTGAAV
jgi:hypothetical protein